MIRCCRLFACLLALVTMISSISIQLASAQDEPAEKPGFSPNAVQDEGSLTQKASFFIGFNMMKNLKKSRAGEVDMEQLFAGMQAASDGDDRKSFIAGYQMITDFKQRGFELELEKVFGGMKAASAGEELGMSQEEVQAMMTSYQKMVEQKKFEMVKKEAAKNLAEGEAYITKMMAENPNAKKLDNGVMYVVLSDGTGPMPTAEDKVKLDYHGTFLNGEVFDSSVKPPSGAPAKPIELVVGQFVPGFSKALQNMKVGSKWNVVIPGPLAYGASGGAGGAIKPNQTLVFEISLLEIVK